MSSAIRAKPCKRCDRSFPVTELHRNGLCEDCQERVRKEFKKLARYNDDDISLRKCEECRKEKISIDFDGRVKTCKECWPKVIQRSSSKEAPIISEPGSFVELPSRLDAAYEGCPVAAIRAHKKRLGRILGRELGLKEYFDIVFGVMVLKGDKA